MGRYRFIECCCTSVAEVNEAVAGGASRIELCENLETGGVTPSRDLIREVLSVCPLPVNVLIRPRGGDFVFSDNETSRMIEDIVFCRQAGASGIVTGALLADGSVDTGTMHKLISAARPLSVTFHRAFDCCNDPYRAIEDIIALGCDRLLTSGLSASAFEGRELIRELVTIAGDRVVVMPGAGIRPSNIAYIDRATGAREFHGSAHSANGHTDRETVSQLVNDCPELL